MARDDSQLDKGTFDRVLAEELAKGTDRRIAEGRARGKAVGGLPNVNTAAIVTSEMFKRRIDRAQGKKDAGGGGSEARPAAREAVQVSVGHQLETDMRKRFFSK